MRAKVDGVTLSVVFGLFAKCDERSDIVRAVFRILAGICCLVKSSSSIFFNFERETVNVVARSVVFRTGNEP